MRLYTINLQRLSFRKSQSHFPPDCAMYSAAIFSTLMLNRWKMGYALFMEMMRSGMDLHTILWHVVIAGCCNRGTWNWEAVEMMKELRARGVPCDFTTRVRMNAVIGMLDGKIQRYDPNERWDR